MTTIYLFCALFALVFVLMYYSSIVPACQTIQPGKSSKITPILLLIGAFVLRIIIAYSTEGHTTDLTCFKSWASMAYTGGLPNFYASEAFTDYPPGYMYVLWVIGFLQSALQLDYSSEMFTLLIKLPAIICDCVSVWFIYKLLLKNTNSTLAICLSLLYAFNPAVIINSAAWAQVDSVFTLFVVLFIYCIIEKKLLTACIHFAIGILIKPQALIFTPILLLYVYKIIFMGDDKAKAIKEVAISALVSLSILFVLIVPFAKNFDFNPVINQYIATLGSYNYASVNAFNLFALFGGIWRDASELFLFIPYSVWTYIFIAGILFVCGYIFAKEKGETNLFLLGAFIITAMFTLATKMHERYVFPALILLLCAFASKKDLRIILAFAFMSIGQYLNTGAMLEQNIAGGTTAPPDGMFVPIVSLINIATFVYITYILFTQNKPLMGEPKEKTTKKPAKKHSISSERKPFELMHSKKGLKITRIDAIIMAAVTLIYAVVAFVNLGDMLSPVTHWDSMDIGDGIKYEFAEGTTIGSMKWFTGVYEERNMDIIIVDDTGAETADTVALGSVFCWHEYTIGTPVRSISLTTTTYDTMIKEIVFTSDDGSIITPVFVQAIQADCGISNLGDEAHILPEVFSYKNSTYFDEIYHARTAYEHVNALRPYENTHPPLGKLIISLGILMFGMNPFGWRFMGTLFGILMLPLIYLFAKKIFDKTSVATVAIILFATDFMHFAQTRIATIDVYITFFIILMYYFMYDYTQKSFYDTPFSKTLIPLALSGICMGLGIASKWTGAYAAIGLAILFFISFGKRIYEYKNIMKNPTSSNADKEAVKNCPRYCIYTLLWCVLFFVVIPFGIYYASYIPYLNAPGMNGFESFIENQVSMFSYHSSLSDTHPFSSQWYEWPVIVKPIWYYSGESASGAKMSIASFGNPFVWWTGIGAFVYCIYALIKKRSYTALFLIIAFFAQYLPWVGISRIVFIYHYFTSVPFIILMIAFCANDMLKSKDINIAQEKAKLTPVSVVVIGLCVVCIWAFCSFYPVLSGLEVDPSYIESLRWYDSWYF